MTYLQILNTIKDTALAQPNVNSVVREFLDLNREDAKYSAVVIQDRDGTRDRIVENDYITYTWHLGYVDRLTYDGSNRDDIISTGINVINNIVNTIRNTWFPELEVSVVDRINTFDQRFTAQCAGVYVVLAVNAQVSDCVDSESTDLYDTYDAKITANGVYHFVPSGRPVDEINITVDVAGKEEVSLIDTVTLNGTHTYVPADGTVYKDVELNVDVHPTERFVQTYTTNGVKTITGEFNGGEITVDVDTDTVWGEITGTITDQTDLIDYVTGKENEIKTWVESQSYINQIKTVNNQSLIGEGNIEISGMTPAQEAAIEPLMNPEEGVLYTQTYEKNMGKYIQYNGSPNSYMQQSLVRFGDDVYCFDTWSLYKMNPDSLIFEKLFEQYNFNFNQPLWKDLQDRIYIGTMGQIDIENGTLIELQMNMNSFVSTGYNKDNIFYGEYGVYILNGDAMKFNEDTQQFINWDITVPEGYYASWEIPAYGLWYDGHFIWWNSDSFMYEIKEYEDHLEIQIVSEPYFPLTVNGNFLTASRMVNVGGELYWIGESGNDSYHLVSGVWETLPWGTIRWIDKNGNNNPLSIQYTGISYNNYLIGYCENIDDFCVIINMSDTEEKTSWITPSLAGIVTTTGNQDIVGQKNFISATFNVLLTNNISAKDNSETAINGYKININSNSYVNVSSDILISGSLAATVDDIFVNIDEQPFGRFSNFVFQNDTYPYIEYWFSVNNRIFRVDGSSANRATVYEFNGTGIDTEHPITFTEIINNGDVFNSDSIYTSENGTYLFGSTNIYKWDNNNSNWETLNGIVSYTNNKYVYWWDGTHLRYSSNMILEENGGNYSWVEDSSPLDTFYDGYYFMDNGNVYVWCTSDYQFRQYDPSTKTYTTIGPGNYFTNCQTYLGKNFFVSNSSPADIVYFDITKASQDQSSQPLTLTGMSLSSSNLFFGVYNDHIYYFKEYNNLYESYDLDIQKPELPSTNGEYVLTGTRVGDSVTYSWETAPDLSSYATQSWATSQFLEESKVWTGTQTQWDALTPTQKESYTIALITE